MANGIYSIEKVNQFFDDVESVRRGAVDAKSRIGLVHASQIARENVESSTSDGVTIGGVTSFGDFQDKAFLHGFKQGKNVKNLQDFYRMNVPLIRANNCQYYKSQRLSGEIDHSLEISRDISVGQNDLVNKFILHLPFNDRNTLLFYPQPGSTSVTGSHLVRYIESGEYVIGYPIVTDNFVDFDNFNDPDAIDGTSGGFFRESTLEPLGIRNSFANPNTNFANIMIEGVRGSMMPYSGEQGDFSDQKGSNILSSEIEFKQSNYDWFEDCQDLVFPEFTFPVEGVLLNDQASAGTKAYSKEGYVSDGTYDMSPFVDETVDKKYFKEKYRQLSELVAVELLFSSSDDLSNIGSRFKSMHKGFIMTPKYDSIVQTVFGGTDSIAFAGLLKG